MFTEVPEQLSSTYLCFKQASESVIHFITETEIIKTQLSEEIAYIATSTVSYMNHPNARRSWSSQQTYITIQFT